MHSAHRTATPSPSTNAQKVLTTYNKQDQADRADIPINPLEDSEALGRIPYFMMPVVQAEQDERISAGITPKDYGKRWRATFRSITGDAPFCMPGDRDTARVYLRKVQTAIRQGGWSPSEWGSLSRAEKVWLRRVNGLDARFEVVGTRPGRLQFHERERMRAIEVSTQLASSLNRKSVYHDR